MPVDVIIAICRYRHQGMFIIRRSFVVTLFLLSSFRIRKSKLFCHYATKPFFCIFKVESLCKCWPSYVYTYIQFCSDILFIYLDCAVGNINWVWSSKDGMWTYNNQLYLTLYYPQRHKTTFLLGKISTY